MKKLQLDEMRKHFESVLNKQEDETEIKFLEKCLEPIYGELKIINSIESPPIETKESKINKMTLRGGFTYSWSKPWSSPDQQHT